MFDRLNQRVGGLWARFAAWFKSDRGKTIWRRLLLMPLVVVLSPYVTVVWRIMFGGDGTASDQMIVIMIVGLILVIRSIRRRLKQLPKPTPAGKTTDTAGQPKPRKPRGRRR